MFSANLVEKVSRRRIEGSASGDEKRLKYRVAWEGDEFDVRTMHHYDSGGKKKITLEVTDRAKAHLYRSVALRILRNLCQDHAAASEPAWEGILKGGVYHIHKNLGVAESVMWGEYFFLEALDESLRLLEV